MKKNRRGIGLFGNFGTGNFGNDGSLRAMVLSTQRMVPQDRVYCIADDKRGVASALGLETIPIHPRLGQANSDRAPTAARKIIAKALLWPYAIRQLMKLRAIIVPGTGILDDFGIGPLGWPYDLFCWFVLARLMGVKVILVSIGAGPIHHPLSRWLITLAARSAHYRSFRDEASRSFMCGIGLDATSDPLYPDLAFALPSPTKADSEGPVLTVGVGVMTYFGWKKNSDASDTVYQDYIKTMVDFCAWLIDCGLNVRLLIGDDSDDRAAQDILKKFRKTHPACPDEVLTYKPSHTVEEIMEQLADIDIAIATRFHNVVCALKMQVPTISIGYAPKNEQLLAEFGLSEYGQHIERLDLALLKKSTSMVINDRAAHRTTIGETCTRFEAALSEQERLLDQMLKTDAS